MRKRLGMITPSSNSVLEPVTSAMLHGVAHLANMERPVEFNDLLRAHLLG